MSSEFITAYQQLNSEQRQAVDIIDGPLLVIAGPGTGKTQLLSTRVANILRSTDTKASNILCLTYTNKAAINMKDRIIQLAGTDGARLPVKTFHSFAGELMNIYPDYFWNAARLSVAPDSVQLEIIESILLNLPLDHPLALKFAGQYTLINEIRKSIGLAKEAGLSPDKLKAIIDHNLAYIDVIEPEVIALLELRLSSKQMTELQHRIMKLPDQSIDEFVFPLLSLATVIKQSFTEAAEVDEGTGKHSAVSVWKKRWYQVERNKIGMLAERRRNEWWRELANVYTSYLDIMHERGFYDYADMIIEVNTQLETHADMLADIQERFNYVLIDEFQDTTPAQLRLAHLVADHHTLDGQPNLMVVGDDDQAIFKFSGAELNNMLSFSRRYTAARTIVLKKNYRSSQQILDGATRIIEQADNRLVSEMTGLHKDLVATKKALASTSHIQTISYASRELQYSRVVERIAKHYEPSKTVAILARSNESLIKMAGLLELAGIPIRYEQSHNILELDIIQQIYLLAQTILAIQSGNKSQSNALLHQIVRHPVWGFDPKLLWQLAVENFSIQDWYGSLIDHENDELHSFGHWLGWLASEAEEQPLAVIIEYLIGLRRTKTFQSPIKQYYLSGDDDRIFAYFQSLSAIQLLRSLVHDFGSTVTPSLKDLVRFIDIHTANDLIVADESPFITGKQAVQLLTVHKAKGLEFDDVYIIDAIEENWQPRLGNRKPPANLPLQPVGDDLNDYIRLLYVAATRTKANLTITSYHMDHVGKEVETSTIVQTAFPVIKETETREDVLTKILESNLHWPVMERGLESALLQAKLEHYSLSVTHLINFINLAKGGPGYFKERNLLMLPEAKSPNLGYGTAIHSAMEFAQKQTNLGLFSVAQTIEVFRSALESQQLTHAEFSRFYRQGELLLQTLFNDYRYTLTKGSLPEQDIRDIQVGNARIRGKLDRIDLSEDTLTIIDYKTGKPLPKFDTQDASLIEKAFHHKLQLIFYALLASEYPRFAHNMSIIGQMVYVEADDPKKLIRTYTPSADEIADLKKLVQIVYRHIIQLDFPDISGYTTDYSGTQQFMNDLLKESI